MSRKKANTVLTAHGDGLPIALNAAGQVDDWIMLLPAGNGGVLGTVDPRGPYRVRDLAQIATQSLQASGGRLPIDENHSIDLAAPKGGASPARGWVVELQPRADGIWGRVEWSPSGAALMSERAYRYISPVFTHDSANNISRIVRAALTNTPNLRGMTALHAENANMDLLAELRKLLGLADDADEAAIIAKITALKEEDGEQVATQAALAPIAKAAGLKDGADANAIVLAVTNLAKSSGDTIVALQSELSSITTKFNSLETRMAKDRATTFVMGEFSKGRVGLKPMIEHYIARHMVDPTSVEKEIRAMPILNGTRLMPEVPEGERLALNMADPNAIVAEANKYRDEQAKLGRNVSIADAVTHIKERAQ